MKNGIKLKGRFSFFIIWPVIISILMLIADIRLFQEGKRPGIIGLVFTLFVMLVNAVVFMTGNAAAKRDLFEFANNYGQTQMTIMRDLTVPFAILSESGQMLWGNEEFVRVIQNKKAARRKM